MSRDTTHSPLLWIVAAGFFMQTLDSTIVNTALPAIALDFGVPALTLKPVVVAYLLTMAMIMPASGWLADRYGSRNVYFTAVSAFVLGSLCCALSHSPDQLVAARILQGMGASMLLPVGRLTVLRAVSTEDFISALAFMSVGGQIGPVFGPVLGGLFVETLSWHWIFLINVPVGIVGLWAIRRFMSVHVIETQLPKFDFIGGVLLAICVVSISTALDVPAETDRGLWALGLCALGILAAVLYSWYARHRDNPLFPLAMFRETNYVVGVIGNLICRIGAAAVPFLLPLMLQLELGYSALHSGMMMVPVALAGAFSKSWISPLVKRFGYSRFLITNTMLVGTLIMSLALFSDGWPLVIQILQLAALGAVNSMQYSAMNSVTLTSLGPSLAGPGNSMFSMVQMIANGLGVTVGGGMVTLFAGPQRHLGPAFTWSFIGVGVITMLSGLIWTRLDLAQLNAPRKRPKVPA